MASPTKTPDMWEFRMASDKDYSDYNKDNNTLNPVFSNTNNLIVQFGLYFMFVHFHVWEWLSIILVVIFGAIWQLKNALIPYVNVKATGYDRRYFGGAGYSLTNELYGAIGILLAFLLDLMWPPAIRQPPQHEELEGDDNMTF